MTLLVKSAVPLFFCLAAGALVYFKILIPLLAPVSILAGIFALSIARRSLVKDSPKDGRIYFSLMLLLTGYVFFIDLLSFLTAFTPSK